MNYESNKVSTDAKNISVSGFRQLFLYRWYPTGKTCLKNIELQNGFTNGEIVRLVNSALSNRALDSTQLFQDLDWEFSKIADSGNSFIVPVSGGCDSAFTLVKMLEKCDNDVNKTVKAVSMKFLNYSEVDNAQRLCDDLGVGLKVLEVNEYRLITDFSKICSMMEVPLERGSYIPSSYYYRYAGSQNASVVTGEMADCIFAPSMPYTLNLNKETNFDELEYKLSVESYGRLFGDVRPKLDFISADLVSPITRIMMYDILHELPYYYETRYRSYSGWAKSYSAFQSINVLTDSLAMKGLHANSGKYLLRNELSKYLKNQNLAWIDKGIFKIEASDYSNVVLSIADYIDMDAEPYCNLFTSKDCLDVINWKGHEKEHAWCLLLLSIFHCWYESKKDNVYLGVV